MELTVRMWFKENYCVTMICTMVLLLSNLKKSWIHRLCLTELILYIWQLLFHEKFMYNVHNHSVLYNNPVRPVICEGWHINHMLRNWPPRYSWNIVEIGALNTITQTNKQTVE